MLPTLLVGSKDEMFPAQVQPADDWHLFWHCRDHLALKTLRISRRPIHRHDRSRGENWEHGIVVQSNSDGITWVWQPLPIGEDMPFHQFRVGGFGRQFGEWNKADGDKIGGAFRRKLIWGNDDDLGWLLFQFFQTATN